MRSVFRRPAIRALLVLILAAQTTPNVVDATPAITYGGWSESGPAWSRFGESVAPAGDVNGDGFTDVIVGAPMDGDGRAYVYHGNAYPGLGATPDWDVTHGGSGAQFGYSVAPAGDVNGDGYDDVLVGAPFADSNRGYAYLYLGSATGLSTTPDWERVGSSQSRTGFSVATAGDVNGDGYCDVLIGAPEWGATFGSPGRAYLHLGSSTGLSTSTGWVGGGTSGSEFGYSVSTCGDVNGDGYSDWLVGSPGYNPGLASPEAGQVQLYLGSSTGTYALDTWTLVGPAANARYGHCVSLAGDVNRDGYADAAIGAPDYPLATQAGRVIVCYGTATGLTNTGSRILSGGSGDQFGFSVAPAGDLDGNGYADLMVGVPWYGATNAGRILGYSGSATGIGANFDWYLNGTQDWAALGHCVATAGDVDGNGFSEYLAAEYIYDDGANINAGRVRLFKGGAEGLATTGGFAIFGDQTGEQYGQSLGSGGDVNGDGYEDLLVGSPFYDGIHGTEAGRVELVYGGSLGLSTTLPAPWTHEGNAVYDWHGSSVAIAGDVNGDGFDDVLVGARGDNGGGANSGRAYLFHGSATGPGAVANWFSTVGGVSDFVGNAVASAGDVNGDGYADVIVGAKDYGSSNLGAAFCYLGSPTGLAATPVWTVTGPHSGCAFGFAVTACDKDGDGYTDLFVSAPLFDDNADDEGLVRGYRGGPTGPETTPTWEWQGSSLTPFPTGIQLGYALAAVASPNGHEDGVAMGAPWATSTFSNEGMVRLEYQNISRSEWGGQTGANLGFALADAGDVNADGLGDLVAGAPYYTDGQNTEGRWGVMEVGGFGAWWSGSNQAGAHGGWAVAAGDFNGDGFCDPAGSAVDYLNGGISQRGRVWSYPGGGTSQFWQTPHRPQIRNSGGQPVSRLGTTDLPDQIQIHTGRAQSPAGRTRIRQEWWIYPTSDHPYLGDLSISWYSGWAETGPVVGSLGSSTELLNQLTGLNPSTLYSVQWRLRTPSPYFPATRWFRPGVAGRNQGHFRTAEPILAADTPVVSPVALAAFPNPFSLGTRLQFEMATAGPVRVRVFDASGRLVRSLKDGVLKSGAHELRWDGRNTQGALVAAGVYLVRVETPDVTAMRRVVRVR